ncbi:MAG: hypothetical protein IPJ65_06145 [Archangiaceae bacterium]|nr:hypothetical protein [Archangiaceae bacterium]
MNRTIKMSGLGLALALVACGGPGAKIGSGKQGAAEALFAAAAPTKGSSNRTAQGIDVSLQDLKVTCEFGGQATLANYLLQVDTSGTGATTGAKYTVKYDQCGLAKTSAGVAVYDGQWDVTQSTAVGSAGVQVKQTFKGKVTVTGAFDDFVDADVTQSVDVSALGQSGGSVSVVLKGTIADTSGSYTYDEAVNVTAGNLSVDVTTH